MLRKVTIYLTSALLIILFVYAASSKVIEYDKFKIELGKSPVLTSFSAFVAIAVPSIELLISVLLAIKQTRQIGLYASLFLLALFTTYLIVILNFSYYIPCSCGGILQDLSWKTHILFNSFFIVITIIAIGLNSRTPKLNNQFSA
ncbi:MAG: MauE/DoxX family redox-associated membrane protein [Flavipsychrobacter sp.]